MSPLDAAIEFHFGILMASSALWDPQQLMMESLGKEKNLAGKIVPEGVVVYGNDGSTDQHSYVQQLRDAGLNFFVTFVVVHNDRRVARFEVENSITSGDCLQGIYARIA